MARVTLRQVAANADVSVTTASQVLNDVPGTRILDATRERVRASAAELGYTPNRLAQGQRLQRSNMLGYGNRSSQEYWSKHLAGGALPESIALRIS